MSCPLTASGPNPTTLSQKASPEAATLNSHASPPPPSAAALSEACNSWVKTPSKAANETPKPPMASLLPNKAGFAFTCSLSWLKWRLFETLTVDEIRFLLWQLRSLLGLHLVFLLVVPNEDDNAVELISSSSPPPPSTSQIGLDFSYVANYSHSISNPSGLKLNGLFWKLSGPPRSQL